MVQSVDLLLDLLQKMLGLHRDLLESARKEYSAIERADRGALDACTLVRETLAGSIRIIEDERIRHARDCARALGLKDNDITVAKVADALHATDPKRAGQLRGLRSGLAGLIEAVLAQGKRNSILLERGLQHVREMKKNALSERDRSAETYGNQGQSLRPQATGLLSKEA